MVFNHDDRMACIYVYDLEILVFMTIITVRRTKYKSVSNIFYQQSVYTAYLYKSILFQQFYGDWSWSGSSFIFILDQSTEIEEEKENKRGIQREQERESGRERERDQAAEAHN